MDVFDDSDDLVDGGMPTVETELVMGKEVEFACRPFEARKYALFDDFAYGRKNDWVATPRVVRVLAGLL